MTDYRIRAHPMKFFRLGKASRSTLLNVHLLTNSLQVFLTLYTENYGQRRRREPPSTANTLNNDVFMVSFGELVFTRIRRFIVIRENRDSCSAL
jgi:hypothetical protein